MNVLNCSTIQIQMNYATQEEARVDWEYWLSWARRSRLDPMKRVAETLGRHLEGVLMRRSPGSNKAQFVMNTGNSPLDLSLNLSISYLQSKGRILIVEYARTMGISHTHS